MNLKFMIPALISLSIGISNTAFQADVILPAKISKAEVEGKIFERDTLITTHEDDGTQLDIRTLLSSDKKFDTGMYQAGASRYEIDEPYGVDEFMYFLKGSVKLTSADGSVQTIGPGEAVTIPKEWTGIWETDGYTKIYVIYTREAE